MSRLECQDRQVKKNNQGLSEESVPLVKIPVPVFAGAGRTLSPFSCAVAQTRRAPKYLKRTAIPVSGPVQLGRVSPDIRQYLTADRLSFSPAWESVRLSCVSSTYLSMKETLRLRCVTVAYSCLVTQVRWPGWTARETPRYELGP